MRTTNPAKIRILQVTEKVIFPDATEQATSGLISKPPTGKYRVTNFYVDPATGKLVVEYDDTIE